MANSDRFVEILAGGPLKFSYPITPLISVDTTVSGEARNVVNVAIVYGTLTLWSGTMLQTAPDITIPYDIVAGEITIEKGGSFHMTPPTQSQMGSVSCNLTIKSQSGTTPFTATIANWPLSSSS